MLDKIILLIPGIVDAINAARIASGKEQHENEYVNGILATLRRIWSGLSATEQRFAGAAILAIAKNQGKPIFAGPLWQYLGIEKLPSVKRLTEIEVASVRQSAEYRQAIERRNAVMSKLRGVLYTTKGGLLHLGASSGSTLDVDALLAELIGSTPTAGNVRAARRK